MRDKTGYHIWTAKLVWLKVTALFGEADVSVEGDMNQVKYTAIHLSNGRWSFTEIFQVCVCVCRSGACCKIYSLI